MQFEGQDLVKICYEYYIFKPKIKKFKKVKVTCLKFFH